MQKANQVGLSKDLKQKVINGTIDITEYDDKTAAKIEEFQGWYDKAKEAQAAAEESSAQIAENYQQIFDNIVASFDASMAEFEHKSNMYNTELEKLEAKGMFANADYYKKLIDIEKQSQSTLNEELLSLKGALVDGIAEGSIKIGSEAYNNMIAEINGVTEAISESELAVLELENSIEGLDWEIFDFVTDQISELTKESDFLIELMSNRDMHAETGELTEEGQATMGLHGLNYNTYMEQSNRYAEELKDIESELAKNPYDKDLIARKQELLSLQRESILSAEEEKQAMISLVEEGINLQLEAVNKSIDAYKEELDAAKDLHDFQKKMEDYSSEIKCYYKTE